MMDPRDADPLYVEEDRLWDPRARVFVPRPRSPLLPMALSALAGAVLASLVWAAVTNGSGHAPPAPEPSFVPVPSMESEVALTVPSAPPVLATPTPRPTAKPTLTPTIRPTTLGNVRRGMASYCAPTPKYCQSWGGTARLAAVPTFHYGDRPYVIRVCRADNPGRCTTATVVSYCACGNKIMDLSPYAFTRLQPLYRGVVRVVVRW